MNNASRELSLCGVALRFRAPAAARACVARAMRASADGAARLLRIATVNPDFLLRARRCARFRASLAACDAHVADGVGVTLAARLCAVRVPHCAGADLFFALLDMAQREGWRVHFFCRADGLSRWRDVRAALAQRYPQLRADGEDVTCADICCSARYAFWRRGALIHTAAQLMSAPLSLCDTNLRVLDDSHYVLCRTKSAKKHISQNMHMSKWRIRKDTAPSACEGGGHHHTKSAKKHISQNMHMSKWRSVFEVLQQVESAPVPVLYFANFGAPEQEVFLDALRDAGARGAAIGVGGAFDFLTGAVARAPRWVRALRMEWLWRTVRQPKRIGKMLRSVVLFPVVAAWECIYKSIRKKSI